MRRGRVGVVGCMIVTFLLSGCASMTPRQKAISEGAAMGAIIGAGGGGAIEAHDDERSDRDKGALLGMLVGGLIGGVIGAFNVPEEKPAPPPPPPAPEPAPVVEPAPPAPAPAPEAAPAPAPVQEAPQVSVIKERIVLRGINFDFDKSNIKPEFEPVLDEAARILKERADVKEVAIEGHTCSIGTEKYNQGLSERRAKSVRDYLVKKGVNAERLTTVGYGETRPITDNKTRAGRQMNRRVEFQVLQE